MTIRTLVTGLMAMLLLSACGSDDDDKPVPTPPPMETRAFTIEVTNITGGQPFSPLAAVAHDGSFALFSVGEPAGVPLEVLAEGGDNTDLIAMAEDSDGVHGTASGMAPVPPGSTDTLMLSTEAPTETQDAMQLELVTMLVNTNDGIGAIQNQPVGALAVGDSLVVTALSFDTGTEANSESADHIPGPAATGGAQEGFNEARDDIDDRVHLHPGVLTQDQGMPDSDLTQAHRWDNPVMRVVITRTE